MAPRRFTRDEVIAFAAATVSSAPPRRYDPQEDWHRAKAALAYDRGYAPDGYARQWSALLRAPERLEDLRSVTVPTLIFHGREDEVLHWCSAVDMAEAIAGSELQIQPDMGHLIPHELWPDLVAAISRTVQRREESVAP